MLWGWGDIQGHDVFKMSSPVKVYRTSSETRTENLRAVTVSHDKGRKVNQKDNYPAHTKQQGKVLQMAAIAGKYLLEAMHSV